MPTISSNTLFHFTRSPETLLNIIAKGFYPRYCLESISVDSFLDIEEEHKEEGAIPMTCFCDLPLSNIAQHLKFYGSYGIGLTKNWARKSGINPMTYINIDSTKFDIIRRISDMLELFENEEMKTGYLADPYILFSEFVAYLKPYEGKMWRNNNYIDKRFYDEKEWRYVPVIEHKKLDYRLTKEEFLNRVKRASANSALEKYYYLKFNARDVKYLIVESDREIVEMFDAIDSLRDLFSEGEMKLMKTRIISSEQILLDF